MPELGECQTPPYRRARVSYQEGGASPGKLTPWPCGRFWCISFPDRGLEERYDAQRETMQHRAHAKLNYILLFAAVLFTAIGPFAPASLVFRVNNWLSWAFLSGFRWAFKMYPTLTRHRHVLCLTWGLHHVTYQSLTLFRSNYLLFLIGLVDSPTLREATLEDFGDEAYQLLWNSLAIIAISMHGCLSLPHCFTLLVFAPFIYVQQLLFLGTCLNPADAIKHVIAYSLLCCLVFLGARQLELDHRNLFLHECELQEELAREREWHRCFGRILASNFDYSTSLKRDLTLPAEDMRLSTWLGTMVQEPLHVYDVARSAQDKQRMREFFENLREQVTKAQDNCHGPEMLSFGLATEANVDVDMQVLWVPGCVLADRKSPGSPKEEGDQAWPAGNLWVCFRQRQLEELRKPPQVKKGHSESSSGEEGLLEALPDFTLTFEAGSPRFTILDCSAGSPLEHAMAQVPDLLDWLPLRCSERFGSWVEEQINEAPDDRPSISASFGAFHLEPPCSDWQGLRVQRALLEIPVYDMDEGRDLPVTLRLMGVQRRGWRRSKSSSRGLARRMRQGSPSILGSAVNPEAILEGPQEEEPFGSDESCSDLSSDNRSWGGCSSGPGDADLSDALTVPPADGDSPLSCALAEEVASDS